MTEHGAGGVLEVDLAGIVANWRLLCRRHPSGPVAGVVKADAYGLGADRVAPALLTAGCRHFFVALPEEAFALRASIDFQRKSIRRPLSECPIHAAKHSHAVTRASMRSDTGLPGAMIAVLNGLFPGAEAEFAARDIVPVLGSLAEIDAWSAIARRRESRLPAILHVDTGMARLGLSTDEVEVLANDMSRLDPLQLLFIMTHLVSSEVPDDPINQDQLRRFATACSVLPDVPRSLANSSGIFLGEDFGSDLARPGAALYGVNPTPEQTNPMRQVVRLRARVLSVREIGPGQGVGYNATWRARRNSRIATASIGYADGWHRSLSNRGGAVFDGQPVPLVGRVSMDLVTFDVTDRADVQPGAWLELIGPHQTPDDVAREAGTNGYEVLTSLGRRFQRIYRGA